VVPRGAVEIVVPIGAACFAYHQHGHEPVGARGPFAIGPSSRLVSATISGIGEAAVIRVGFESAAALLGGSPAMLRDRAVDLASIDCRFAASLSEVAERDGQDLESRLGTIVHRRVDAASPATLQAALAEIGRTNGALSAGQLARRLGVALRTLQRLFEASLGLPPSAFIGLARVQAARRALSGANPVDVAELALSLGYYDQAHFTNHFGAVCGSSPVRGRAVPNVAFFQEQDATCV
jgi:AraC-like DNA-binding protein